MQATLTESARERRFRRTVTLEDAIGVGSGPHTEHTALTVRAFETQNDVLERYYGSWVAVGVALVSEGGHDKLEVSAAPDVALKQDAEELLFRAYALYRQVDLTFATGRDRALCLRMLYDVISGLFKELDRTAATRAEGGPVECARIEYLTAALARAEGYFRRAAQRRAQQRYLGGVIGGLSAIAGVGLLLWLALSLLPQAPDQSGMYVASLVAGGVGALLSVLYGMTSGNLRLHTLFANAESGCGPLVIAGALRPLLGALSGTVVYVLLQSGFIPLEVPNGQAGTHFCIAIAIVAGFSERWARGVLAGTEKQLPSAAKPKP